MDVERSLTRTRIGLFRLGHICFWMGEKKKKPKKKKNNERAR